MKTASDDLKAALYGGNVHEVVNLFTFYWKDGTISRWSGATRDVTVGGTTWGATAAGVTVGQSRAAADLSVDSLDLTIYPDPAVLVGGRTLLALAVAEDMSGIRIVVHRGFCSTPGTDPVGVVMIWDGYAEDVKPFSSRIELTVKSILARLEDPFPTRQIQTSCPFSFAGTECGLAPAAYQSVGVVCGGTTVSAVNTLGVSNPGSTKLPEWWTHGTLLFTSGALVGVARGIVLGAIGNDGLGHGTLQLQLAHDLPSLPALGDTFTVMPGCDRTTAACDLKFSNLIHFGGFPYVPPSSTTDRQRSALLPQENADRNTTIPIVYGRARIPLLPIFLGLTHSGTYRASAWALAEAIQEIVAFWSGDFVEKYDAAAQRFPLLEGMEANAAHPEHWSGAILSGAAQALAGGYRAVSDPDLIKLRIGYGGIAKVYQFWWNCQGGTPNRIDAEVRGLLCDPVTITASHLNANGGKVIDGMTGGGAHPADVLVDLLCTPRVRWAGLPSSTVQTDVGPDGTAASSWRTYCTALGFRVNRAITGQTTMRDLVEELVQATNSVAVWSQGTLKIVPLGGDAITANGVTYTPSVQSIVLNEDEILATGDDDPIEIDIASDAEVYNCCPVTIANRDDGYEQETFEVIDGADAALRGVRRAEAVRNEWIATADHATRLSTLLSGASLHCRKTFRFRVGPRWALLEPGDVIALTESHLGLAGQLAMIQSVEEQDDGSLEIQAAAYSSHAYRPVDVTPQAVDGMALNDPDRTGVDLAQIDQAVTDAAGAQAAADLAQAAADAAQAAADAAKTTADTAKGAADTATATADTAKATADTAKATADTARGTADTAKATADTKAAKDLSDALAGSVAARLIPSGLIAGGNLLCNSSFDSAETWVNGGWGTLPGGWNLYNNGGEPCTCSVEASGGVDGGPFARCAWSVLNTSTRGIRTTADLSVGGRPAGVQGGWRQDQWYTVSLWARGSGGIVGAAISLQWNTNPTETAAPSWPPLSGAWQRYVFRIRWVGVSPEGSGRLYISTDANAASATLDLDQIQISEGAVDSAYTPRASELLADSIRAGMVSAGVLGARELAAGSVTTKQLTVANFDNLVPNANCAITNAPADALESAGLAHNLGTNASIFNPPANGYCRTATAGPAGYAYVTIADFPVTPGDQYFFQGTVALVTAGAGGAASMLLQFLDATGTYYTNNYSDPSYALAARVVSGYATAATNDNANHPAVRAKLMIALECPTATQQVVANWFYCRRMADANVIVDGAITAGKIKAGEIATDKLILGGVTLDRLATSPGYNLIANPTSEIAPPTGADLTGPEWIGRYDAGVGNALAGKGVRRFVLAAGVQASARYIVGRGPCSPGERHFFAASMKGSNATGTLWAEYEIRYVDGNGATLGGGQSAMSACGTGWTPQLLSAGGSLAPSGAVEVQFLVGRSATAGNAGGEVWFDGLSARRMLDTTLEIQDASIGAGKLKLGAIGPSYLATSLALTSVADVTASGTGTYSFNTLGPCMGSIVRVAIGGTNMPGYGLDVLFNGLFLALAAPPVITLTPWMQAGGNRIVPFLISQPANTTARIGFWNMTTSAWVDPGSVAFRFQIAVISTRGEWL